MIQQMLTSEQIVEKIGTERVIFIITTLINQSANIYHGANNYFKSIPNTNTIFQQLKLSANSNPDKIDDFLRTFKEKHIGNVQLSKTEFEKMKQLYDTEKGWLKFFTQSYESDALWKLATNNIDNDTKKAEKIINFMCNKEHWKLKSCVMLWEKYAKGTLFETPTASPQDNATAPGQLTINSIT